MLFVGDRVLSDTSKHDWMNNLEGFQKTVYRKYPGNYAGRVCGLIVSQKDPMS